MEVYKKPKIRAELLCKAASQAKGYMRMAFGGYKEVIAYGNRIHNRCKTDLSDLRVGNQRNENEIEIGKNEAGSGFLFVL